MKISTQVLVVVSALMVVAAGVGAYAAMRESNARQVACFASTRITCGACSEKITVALRELPGVKGVNVEVANQQVRVGFDPQRVDPERIAMTLNNAGFPARLVTVASAAETANAGVAKGGCGGGCCPPRQQ